MQITVRSKCCGCAACYSVCPVNAISMESDEKGFLYPSVNEQNCIKCGLCKKVCPVNHTFKKTIEPKVYAAVSKSLNVIRSSASGGVFFHLASQIINNHGVVFGAKLHDDLSIIHDFTERISGLPQFMGSKYVQSQIGKNYKIAKQFLDAGRQVLFTGVPCQILALRNYLQKEYDNLLAVNVICHSCPSPKVFKVFIEDICQKASLHNIRYLTMRYKKSDPQGNIASNYFAIFDQIPQIDKNNSPVYKSIFYESSFGRGFGSGIFARPSCFACPAKNLTSGSDITIGDFWGIEKYHPNLNSRAGVSLVIIETNKGARHFNTIATNFDLFKSTLEQAIEKNPRLVTPLVASSSLREKFWQEFIIKPSANTINKHTKPTFKSQVKRVILAILRKYVL